MRCMARAPAPRVATRRPASSRSTSPCGPARSGAFAATSRPPGCSSAAGPGATWSLRPPWATSSASWHCCTRIAGGSARRGRVASARSPPRWSSPTRPSSVRCSIGGPTRTGRKAETRRAEWRCTRPRAPATARRWSFSSRTAPIPTAPSTRRAARPSPPGRPSFARCCSLTAAGSTPATSSGWARTTRSCAAWPPTAGRRMPAAAGCSRPRAPGAIETSWFGCWRRGRGSRPC